DAALLARRGNDEIPPDLFGDYPSNVAMYPALQSYFRAHPPPLLAAWGRNHPFFFPAGAATLRRHIEDAAIVFFDTGHFALETHVREIADAIGAFLANHLPVRQLAQKRLA